MRSRHSGLPEAPRPNATADHVAERRLSRRRFLELAGGSVAAAALAPILAGCGGGRSGPELSIWWWGEQEANDVGTWMKDTIARFEEREGYTVDARLLGTNDVISQFASAAAAGKPPDVEFLYNGVYHMENVWLGYLSPLNGLVQSDVLRRSGATALSVYRGKQYRVGFYVVGFGMLYDKDVFDGAGLDADRPPRTWDELLDACERLEAAGVVPIGGGARDGFFGEWYFVNSLTQSLDSPADAIDLFLGDRSFEDPRYHEHWSKLRELRDRGFLNDDIAMLDLYDGIDLVLDGKAAMTLARTTDLPGSRPGGTVGFFVMPTFGTGTLAGRPIADTQGFGIPSAAKDREGAAKLLELMHSPERVNALYTLSKALPADGAFDSSLIDDPAVKAIYDTWWQGEHTVYIADLMPTLFWTDALSVATRDILAGTMTGAQAGRLAAGVAATWTRQNPDLAEHYRAWRAELAV